MATKKFKTFSQQAKILVNRGMTSSKEYTEDELIAKISNELQFINYYRLSAYWYPFYKQTQNQQRSDEFRAHTYWETVRDLYMFDRHLRSLLFEAISRIEIALRTQIAHIWAQETRSDAPQGITKFYNQKFIKSNNNKESGYETLLKKVNLYYQKSNSDCAKHHKEKYNILRAEILPIWVFVEFTTFGNLASLYANGLPTNIRNKIAGNFHISKANFFKSIINLLNDVRNTCAHQGRIWNTKWTSSKNLPLIKNPLIYIPTWGAQEETSSNTFPLTTLYDNTATVLTLCYLLLKIIAPANSWKARLKDLLNKEIIPGQDMSKHIGFTNKQWDTHPLWN